MHTFVLFYVHNNKNINYNQISPNSITKEILLPFFRIFSMIPLYDRIHPSQPMLKSLYDKSINTSMILIRRYERHLANKSRLHSFTQLESTSFSLCDLRMIFNTMFLATSKGRKHIICASDDLFILYKKIVYKL